MLKKLNALLSSLLNTTDNSKENSKDNNLTLELACSVLLCEVMRADQNNTLSEQRKLKDLISQQFSLTHDEANSIMEIALGLSENATDFYQFTRALNEHYSVEQRIQMVNLLWQVAYADGELANIEEHIIRKIADLLHLRDTEYVATKIDAKAKYDC
jgi:uncharacterized tellurite resistance protein B-like protein